MGDFRRDNRSDGGRSFDRPQVMHKTICSNCGNECEVPFKPTGSKPVFCRDCFQSKRSGERSENFRRPDFQDRNSNPTPRAVEQPQQPQYKEQFEALNAKLDKILNLLTTKDLRVKEVEISELDQIPQIEIPIIKKKRVSKK